MKKFIPFALISLLVNCDEESLTFETKYANVAVLNVREKPAADAKKIGVIFGNTKLEAGKVPVKDTIENKSDFWYKIKGSPGFAFGAFLSNTTNAALPVVKMSRLSTGVIDCYHMNFRYTESVNFHSDKVVYDFLFEGGHYGSMEFHQKGTYTYENNAYILNLKAAPLQYHQAMPEDWDKKTEPAKIMKLRFKPEINAFLNDSDESKLLGKEALYTWESKSCKYTRKVDCEKVPKQGEEFNLIGAYCHR